MLHILFVDHEQIDAPEQLGKRIQAIKPAGLALECAYDDDDPTNCARKNLGALGIDLHRALAGSDMYIEPEHRDSLIHGRLIIDLISRNYRLPPQGLVSLDDVGNHTDSYGMSIVSLGVDEGLCDAYEATIGFPDRFIRARSDQLAHSFRVREAVVASQLDAIEDVVDERDVVAVVGSDHIGLIGSLARIGKSALSVFVHPHIPSPEVLLSVLCRNGGELDQLDEATLRKLGIAQLVAGYSAAANIGSWDLYRLLASSDAAEGEFLYEAMMAQPGAATNATFDQCIAGLSERFDPRGASALREIEPMIDVDTLERGLFDVLVRYYGLVCSCSVF